jgi:glycosyltransferase involved in cell wall biosynthesis
VRERLTGGRIEAPLLLYAGRLSPEKNLGALAPLLERLPGACLAFVGDGPSRSELERRFRRLPAVFTGHLRGADLAAVMASADVFVMPSATETLGFVVLEAMAAGCPVVAADAGGVTELVEHGARTEQEPRDERGVARAQEAVLRVGQPTPCW